MSKVKCAAALGAVLALAFPASAQNASQAGAPSEPVIRAKAYEVALDLVVRDKKGRLVKNLAPADLEIYEDGVRQQVLSMRLVNGEAVPAQPASAQPAEPSSPGPTPPITLPDLNLVCIVFHNLDSLTRAWAIGASQEFIKTQLRPDTWVGIFNLGERLTPLYPFTTNRDDLLTAASKAFVGTGVDLARAADSVQNSTPNLQLITGFVSGNTGGAIDRSTTGSVSMSAINGADVSNGPGANAQRGDLVIQREQFIGVEGARQMDQIKAMVGQFGKYPGHKTVLLFSAGLTTTGDPDQFQAMVTKANQADLTVYAFDSRGLDQTSTAQSSSMAMQHVTTLSKQQGQALPGVTAVVPGVGPATGGGGYEMEQARQGDYQTQAVRTSDSQSALRALAEDTGGFLIANSNDLRKPLQQIAGDVAAHYDLHYRPASEKLDGHFRKIEVKLAHADWKAEWREGYFALPDRGGAAPLRPFEMAGLVTLSAQSQPRAFDFRSAAFQFRPGASSQSAIVFEFAGGALSATPLAALKKHRITASLFAVVKDSDGQVVDTFGREFQYAVPDDQLAGVQAAPIDYRHAFHLPAGHYKVESVLLDRESQRASTSMVEFDSPAAKGVGLSSLMLVARADPLTAEPEADDPLVFQDREMVPMLSPFLKPASQPMLYFVVYPDKALAEPPRLRVQFLVNGEELEQKQSDLPAPDASGAIPVLVNAATRTGNCEIRITAVQGFQTATRSVTYTVAAQ
jgi:VWFA-related protein